MSESNVTKENYLKEMDQLELEIKLQSKKNYLKYITESGSITNYLSLRRDERKLPPPSINKQPDKISVEIANALTSTQNTIGEMSGREFKPIDPELIQDVRDIFKKRRETGVCELKSGICYECKDAGFTPSPGNCSRVSRKQMKENAGKGVI